MTDYKCQDLKLAPEALYSATCTDLKIVPWLQFEKEKLPKGSCWVFCLFMFELLDKDTVLWSAVIPGKRVNNYM